MTKAVVATPSGARVTIEGTNDEVVGVVACLEALGTQEAQKAASARTVRSTSKKPKPTLMGLLSEMVGGGFFKQPKRLGAVKTALEEAGEFYATTTLSPALLRMVRA